MLPIVHNASYVAPLPGDHRFPMRKFGRLVEVLFDLGMTETVQPEPAPRGWLELVHAPAYVSGILEQSLEAAAVRRIGLPLTPGVAARARAAVGGTVLTARLALVHGIACNTAGGSHHAHAGFGAGFCVFNDVAVAARTLQAEGLAPRILVIDLDVHQGDGTAAIFHGDDSVITFSMHCEKNFPARKQQSDLDIALQVGTGDAPYLEQLGSHLARLIEEVRPDLAFYNAGVDPHADDRLGRLALSDAGLWAREELVLGCLTAAGIPAACVIGGGYADDIDALAQRHAILHRTAAQLAAR
jgi:acetoin utilization deacetylase AcuC-like enzyme